MSCAQAFTKHKASWELAIKHQFLAECKDGTLRKSQFDTWLVQDYSFAREFTRFAASLLSKAPYRDFDTLLGGLEALRGELKWFQDEAVKRKLSLDAKQQPANQSFCQYMQQATQQPYPVQAMIFWSIEQAYYEAWHNAAPIAEAYKQYAERWGSGAFGDYCKALEHLVDTALQQASQAERDAAVEECGKVAEHERAFWQMAYEG